MGDIYIPPEIQWVSYLAGDHWPQGSENGMWGIDEILKAAAEELIDLLPDLNLVRGETLSSLVGDTAAIADEHFRMLFDGDYAVDKLADAVRALGESAAYVGSEIEWTKLSIIVGLILAAAEITYSLAMSGPTYGASLSWIPIVELVTILGFRRTVSFVLGQILARVRQMLTKTMVKQMAHAAPREAAEELGIYAVEQGTVAGLQGDRYIPNTERLLLGAAASTAGGGGGGGVAPVASHMLGPAATRGGARTKGLVTMGIAGFTGNVVGQASIGQNPFEEPVMLVTSSAMTSVGGARGAGVQSAHPRTTFTHPPGPGSPPPGLPPINGDRNGGWAPRGGEGAHMPTDGRVPNTIGQGYGGLTPRGGDGAQFPTGQPVPNTAPPINDVAGQQDTSASLATQTLGNESTTDNDASQTGPPTPHSDPDDQSTQSTDGVTLSGVDITNDGPDNGPIAGTPVADVPDPAPDIEPIPTDDAPADADVPPAADLQSESTVEAAADRSATLAPDAAPVVNQVGPAPANASTSPSAVGPSPTPVAQAPPPPSPEAPSTPDKARTQASPAAAPKREAPEDVSAPPNAAATSTSQVSGTPDARVSQTTAARSEPSADQVAADKSAAAVDGDNARVDPDSSHDPAGLRTDEPADARPWARFRDWLRSLGFGARFRDNCGEGVVDRLAAHHGRPDARLGVKPTAEGLPAREVFKAFNARPEAGFTTFADAAEGLRALEAEVDSKGEKKEPSAILTWSWARDGGQRGGHSAALIKRGEDVYLYDPHTKQEYQYDPETRQFTGYVGQDTVSKMAVGYVKPDGYGVTPLDGTPGELAVADEIGWVQGHPDDAPRVSPVGNTELAVVYALANAEQWKGLSRDEAVRRREAHPYETGNAKGIPPEHRNSANRDYLSDQLDAAASKHLKNLEDFEMGLLKADLAAELEGERQPLLMAFDPHVFSGDGRAVISFGEDPFKAKKVVWLFARAPINQLGDFVGPALDQLQAAKQDTESAAVMLWIGDGTPTTGLPLPAPGALKHLPLRQIDRDIRGLLGSPTFLVRGIQEQHFGRQPPESDPLYAFYSDLAGFRAERMAWAETGQVFTDNVYALPSTTDGLQEGLLKIQDGVANIVGEWTLAGPAPASHLLDRADGFTGLAAHRGDNVHFPENTWAAFKAALDKGAVALELDVQITKDGHVVVIHDPKVDRTSDGTGYVFNKTLAELRALDFGNGERILTLEELVAKLREDGRPVTLFVEAKPLVPVVGDGKLERGLVAALQRAHLANPAPGDQVRAVVTSFDPRSLLQVRRAAAALPTVWNVSALASPLLVSQTIAMAKAFGVNGLAHEIQTLKAFPETVALAATEGIATIAGPEGSDSHTDVQYLRALGAHFLMTNDPEVSSSLLLPPFESASATTKATDAEQRILSYEEFGRNFFEVAVTEQRVADAFANIAGAGGTIEIGPIEQGPAKISATAKVGQPRVERTADDPITFDVRIPLDMELDVDLRIGKLPFKVTAEIGLSATAHAAEPLLVILDVDKPNPYDIAIEVSSDSRLAELLGRKFGVEFEIARFIADYVGDKIDSPNAQAAQVTNIAEIIAPGSAALVAGESTTPSHHHVSYEQFGHNFFDVAVTEQRIADAFAQIAGGRVEIGPIEQGPGNIARVSATATVGNPAVERTVGDPITFDIRIPLDMELVVDLGLLGKQPYKVAGEIGLRASARAGEPLQVILDIEKPNPSDIAVIVSPSSIGGEVLRRVGGLDAEIQRRIAELVGEKIDSPDAKAARVTDVASKVAPASSAVDGDNARVDHDSSHGTAGSVRADESADAGPWTRFRNWLRSLGFGATRDNCGEGVVNRLAVHHGRTDVRLGVKPTSQGLPAREVFKAFNARPEPGFTTFADAAEGLLALAAESDVDPEVESDFSAILTWSWAGEGGQRGGHSAALIKRGDEVYLYDPHTDQHYQYDPGTRQFTGYVGQDTVSKMAVGYVKPDGYGVTPLDGTPGELAPADEIGMVQGLPDPVLAALNQRVPTGPTDALINDVVHDLADAERAEARARENVAWMARLHAGDAEQTRGLIAALINAHPFAMGNTWGIPEAITHEANRKWLDRKHALADQLGGSSWLFAPGERRFADGVAQLEASLREIDEALEGEGLPPLRLFALNPAEFRGRTEFLGNGRAVIVIGDDPYSAERVSWHVGSEKLNKLGEPLIRPALEQLLVDHQETGSAAAIICIGTGRGANDAFYSDLAAFRAAREALVEAGQAEPLTEQRVYNLRPPTLAERAASASIRANPLWVPPEASPRVTAHGGGPYDRPEQTLAAYEESRRQGADAFEGDAQLTADQQLVLLHNPSVKSTSDGTGLVHKMTLEELQQLDFGVKHPSRALGEAQGDTRIMTVEQLLQFVAEGDRQLTAVIETKHWIPNRNYFDLERRLADLLIRYGCANPAAGDQPRAVILSFWPESLAMMRRLAPGVPTVYHAPPLKGWANVVAAHHLAKRVGAVGIDHYFDTLRAYPQAADHARRLGLVVWARTKNERDAQYAKALGVAWMGSDHPGRTVQWLGRGSPDSDTMRLPPMPPANEFVHPIGKPQVAVGRARRNVDWLNRLSESRTDQEMRDLIDALIATYPYRIGNADGFLPADRDKAIREYLGRVVNRARAKLHGDQPLSEAARKAAERANRIGLAWSHMDGKAELVGVGKPLMLAFNHREFGGDGRAVVSFGDDPYHADEVVWLIARQPVDQLDSIVLPAVEHLEQMRAAAPGKRIAVIVSVGNTTLPGRDSHTAFFSDLAAFRAVREALAEIGKAEPLNGNRVRALDFRVTAERAAEANTLWLHPDSDPLVFGHRGSKDLLPENTLAAFRLALEQGADALECDVQLSKDGQPVVLHDPIVNRTTEGSGWVHNMTAAELQELGVPTLAQLLDLVIDHNGPVTLFTELKHYGPKDKNLESRLVELLSSPKYRHLLNPRPDDQTRVAVHAMRKDHLKLIRGLAPNLPTVLLAPRMQFLWEVSFFLKRAKDAGANAVSLYQTLRAFPEAVDLAHRQGLNVWAGVVHNAVEAQYLVDLGVDIIGSNNPGPTLDWIGLGPAEPATPTTASRTGAESRPNFGRSEPGHPDGPHREGHRAAEDSGIVDDTRPGWARRLWNMLTGAKQNCGEGVVKYLSVHHGRPVSLGVAASRKGLPAREVFKAFNARPEPDFTTFADAAEGLRALKVPVDPKAKRKEPSAILTWSWAAEGGKRGGHSAALIKRGEDVYLYDPHTRQEYQYDPETREFTGYVGQHTVSHMAVGYVKPDGYGVTPLDGTPGELAVADAIGHVQGPQPDDRGIPRNAADREDVDVPLRLDAPNNHVQEPVRAMADVAGMHPDVTTSTVPTPLRLVHGGRESSLELGVAEEIRVGSSTDANVVIASASVSPEHVTIGSGRDGQLWIRDDGSANGTWVNGDRLPPNHEYLLRDGDVIRLGDYEITARCTPPGPEPVTVRLTRGGDVVPLRLTPGSEMTLGQIEDSVLATVFGESEGMSRNHASIGVTWDGHVWIRDNGSLKGTWINEHRITPGRKVLLYSEDKLNMGGVATRVTTEPEPAELVWMVRLTHEIRMFKILVRPGTEVSLGSEESSALPRRIAELPGVEPSHVTFGVTPEGRAWIRDNGSPQGTRVKDRRCPPFERVMLRDNEAVTLGEDGPGFALLAHSTDRPALDLRLVGRDGETEVQIPARTELKLGSHADSPLAGVNGIAPDHARFGIHPDGYVWVRDTGSRAATFVNGERVGTEPIRLRDGDVVLLSWHEDLPMASLLGVEFTVRFDEPARLEYEQVPVALSMPGLGQAEPLQIDLGSDVLLGRAEASPLHELLGSNDSVADSHASIGVHPSGRVWIRDNGSTNGTWLNDVRIEEGRKIPLRPGDRIRIGELETTVEFSAPPLPDIIRLADASPGTQQAIEDMALIPPAVYDRIMEHLEGLPAGGVTLGNRGLAYLPGVDGMESAESKWAGVYDSSYRRILVNTGDAVDANGNSVVLHEFGHAASHAYGDGIHWLSETPEWAAVHELVHPLRAGRGLQRLRRQHRQRVKHYDAPEELFAAGFASWLEGDEALLVLAYGDAGAAAKLKEYFDGVFGPLE
jgi:glycerophosphoryl diester phosphodiesterase/pSer/pThr/pTyr-binding forkhead associated (FHA) protein